MIGCHCGEEFIAAYVNPASKFVILMTGMLVCAEHGVAE
jgi:hypothetical protein